MQGHIASAWLADPDFPLPVLSWSYREDIRTSIVVKRTGSVFCLGALVMMQPVKRLIRELRCLVLAILADRRLIGLPEQEIRRPSFPRFHRTKNSLEFSFSGLKTSLLYKLRGMAAPLKPEQIADLAAGYQEAIIQVLVMKSLAALKQANLSALAVVGGVSANSRDYVRC
ncbi:MAG: hypothetical protein U0236_13305 [Nitrospira sp.]